MHKKTTRIINPVFDGLAGDTGQHLLLTFVPRHIDPDDARKNTLPTRKILARITH